MQACNSATVVEPAQPNNVLICPKASAGAHFLTNAASVEVKSAACLVAVLVSVGGTKAPPENEPMQMGARSPTVPAFMRGQVPAGCVSLQAVSTAIFFLRNFVPWVAIASWHRREPAATVVTAAGTRLGHEIAASAAP